MCGGEEGSPQVTIVLRQLAVALGRKCVRFDLTGCLVVLPDRQQALRRRGEGRGQKGKRLRTGNETKGWIGTEEKVDSTCTTCLLISRLLSRKSVAPMKLISESTVLQICLHSTNWILTHVLILGLRVERRPLSCGWEGFQQRENRPGACFCYWPDVGGQLRWPEGEPDCLKIDY